jgi:hypothetical protein
MFTAYIQNKLTSVFVCLFTVTLPGVCPMLFTNTEVGEKLGFNGTDLHDYIKVEQDITREDRKMLRELDMEKLELENKHKLELIAKLGDIQVITGDLFR